MSVGTPTPVPTGGKYQPGDRCFTKLKGWPWWPSKIKERISGKVEAYKVYFYGTYDEGTAKLDQLMEYSEENMQKFKNKPPRNVKFPLAMKEIERNMEIVDSSTGSGSAASSQNTDEVEVRDPEDDGALLIDEKPPVLIKEGKTPKQPGGPKKSSIRAISPDMVEEKPKPTPKRGRAPKQSVSTPTEADTPTRSITAESVSTPIEPSGPQQPEIVSRSGRKIKPKRFADDFDTGGKTDQAETPPASKRTKRMSSTGTKTPVSDELGVEAAAVDSAPPVVKKRMGRPPSTPKPGPPPLIPRADQQSLTKVSPVTSSLGPPPLTKGRQVAAARKPPVKSKPVLQAQDEQPFDELNDEEVPVLEDERLPHENQLTSSEQGQELAETEGETSQVKDTRYKYTNGSGFVEDTGEDDEQEEDDGEDAEKIPIVAKNMVEVRLRVKSKAKENIKSPKAKAAFEQATIRNVEAIKTQLQQSEASANNFLESITKNAGVRDEELKGYFVGKLKETASQQIKVLHTEGEMIELIAEVITALGLKSADPDRAIELLERIRAQKLEPHMLKDNQEVVDTVKKLRRYEGNVNEWNFTESQKAEFANKAEQIRNKSEAIYQSFKSLFCSSAPKPHPVPVPAPVPESSPEKHEGTEESAPSVLEIHNDNDEPEAPTSILEEIKDEVAAAVDEEDTGIGETQPLVEASSTETEEVKPTETRTQDVDATDRADSGLCDSTSAPAPNDNEMEIDGEASEPATDAPPPEVAEAEAT